MFAFAVYVLDTDSSTPEFAVPRNSQFPGICTDKGLYIRVRLVQDLLGRVRLNQIWETEKHSILNFLEHSVIEKSRYFNLVVS